MMHKKAKKGEVITLISLLKFHELKTLTEKERNLLNGAHMISHLNQSVTSLDNKRIYSSFDMTKWV